MSTAVAMIGTGGWARDALAPAVLAVPGAAIVACASPDLAQARQFAAGGRPPAGLRRGGGAGRGRARP